MVDKLLDCKKNKIKINVNIDHLSIKTNQLKPALKGFFLAFHKNKLSHFKHYQVMQSAKKVRK